MSEEQILSTRYLIQEKYLSLQNRFTITDNAGTIRYTGNASFFTMGDKVQIFDANGNEMMKIRQDSLHLHMTYRIFSTYAGATERQIALIKRTGPLWEHKLQINCVHGDYKIERRKDGPSSDEFVITKDGDTVAHVTKDASPTKTFYWVDIVDSKEQNHILLLAMVIVLSCAQRIPVNLMAKPMIKSTKSM